MEKALESARAQEMTDWLAWAQSDSNDPRYGSLSGEGGWSYGAMDNTGTGTESYGADNSNGGYAVLGLVYAKDFARANPPNHYRDQTNEAHTNGEAGKRIVKIIAQA